MTENSPPGKWLMEGERCIICGESDPALLLDEPIFGEDDYLDDSLGAWWQAWLELEPGDIVNLCLECIYK